VVGQLDVSSLEAVEARAEYGPYKALNGLNLTIGDGEMIALLGRNGVGKSTLARVASGLVPLSGGFLTVLGSSVTHTTAHEIARRGVVHLPEGVGLFTGLSIEENLSLRVGGATRVQRRERLEHAFEMLGPLRDRRRSRAGQLSGGQQRLVAVTGAIAAQPRLLLADEPALGLSPAAADDVYGALETLRQHSTATVIIETRLGRVERLCSRMCVMSAGVLVYDGKVEGARELMTSLITEPGEPSPDNQG
jgi:branched-chain amino acid transport system ATP-binding protein